ncbi:MAG: hypothetical protein AAF610_14985, partial [Pseudomonadota bacterium]
MMMVRPLAIGLAMMIVGFGSAASADRPGPTVGVPSLSSLSIDALRERRYGAALFHEQDRSNDQRPSSVLSYSSDGLRVFARLDLPGTAPPPGGYPVAVFVHGWRGIDAA